MSLVSATWDLTSDCICDCVYCLCERATPEHHPTDDDLPDRVTYQLIDLEVPFVCLSGGEPLLSPWLGQAVDRLAQAGAEVTVLTSGAGPVSDSQFDALRGASTVQVSIDSLDEHVNDSLRGRVGAHAESIALVRRLLESSPTRVRIACTVTAVNLASVLESIAEWTMDERVSAVVLQPALPLGMARSQPQLFITAKQRIWLRDSLAELPPATQSKVVLLDDPYEQFRTNARLHPDLCELHIKSTGVVTPHVLLNWELGSVHESTLAEILEAHRGLWASHSLAELGVPLDYVGPLRPDGPDSPRRQVTSRPNDRLTLSPGAEFTANAPDHMMFNGRHYVLNVTAAQILSLCDGYTSLGDIAETIGVANNADDIDAVQADILEAADYLTEEAICRRVP